MFLNDESMIYIKFQKNLHKYTHTFAYVHAYHKLKMMMTMMKKTNLKNLIFFYLNLKNN